MAIEYYYRIRCQTCGDVHVWSESIPTECPNNAGHSLTSSAIAALKKRDNASFVSSGALVGSQVSVTQDSTWQKIAEKSTNAQALLASTGHSADLSMCYGKLTINAEVAGAGAQVKLVERDEDAETESDMMSSPSSVAATSGKKAISKYTTDVDPSTGDKTYILYARLNGATSFDIYNASLTLVGCKE